MDMSKFKHLRMDHDADYNYHFGTSETIKDKDGIECYYQIAFGELDMFMELFNPRTGASVTIQPTAEHIAFLRQMADDLEEISKEG